MNFYNSVLGQVKRKKGLGKMTENFRDESNRFMREKSLKNSVCVL